MEPIFTNEGIIRWLYILFCLFFSVPIMDIRPAIELYIRTYLIMTFGLINCYSYSYDQLIYLVTFWDTLLTSDENAVISPWFGLLGVSLIPTS